MVVIMFVLSLVLIAFVVGLVALFTELSKMEFRDDSEVEAPTTGVR